jgi:hypothetical protein
MARTRITGSQIVDADVLSEAEHDAWVHTNLVCSGTVNIQDAPVMLSGTGDIYYKDAYGESTYLGDTKLSSNAERELLVDGIPVVTTATISGYTGAIPVITSVSFSGAEYVPPSGDEVNISFEEGTATQMHLVFQNGILTTYSGGLTIPMVTPGDNLLSIL